jgi:hypothetical protein
MVHISRYTENVTASTGCPAHSFIYFADLSRIQQPLQTATGQFLDAIKHEDAVKIKWLPLQKL